MEAPEYSLGLLGELKRSLAFTWRWFRVLALICFGLSLLFILVEMALGPMNRQPVYTWPGDQMLRVRTIGEGLLYYASHHGGKFPDGRSSTEVFQKVLDFGYARAIDGVIVHDPAIFMCR